MDVESSPAAPKLLAQDLQAAETVKGGFQLGSLPIFDRVWLQGHVRQKLAGVLKLDDGTGTVDVVAPATAAPGLELDSVQLGDYVLVVGKLLKKQGGRLHLHVKAHKLLNFSQPCRQANSAEEAAEAQAAVQRRMVQWSLEVAELHRVLEAAQGAAAAHGAAPS